MNAHSDAVAGGENGVGTLAQSHELVSAFGAFGLAVFSRDDPLVALRQFVLAQGVAVAVVTVTADSQAHGT